MLVTVKILNDFLSKFDVNHNKQELKADKIKRTKTIIKKYKFRFVSETFHLVTTL